MLTDIQRVKQTHYFNLVDSDKDGFITASDWAEIGRNLASMRNLNRGTPGHDAVMATMGTIWANLSKYCSDENGTYVSLDDWLLFEDEKVINCDDDSYEDYVNTIARGVFALLDSESDGWIGQGQYIDLAMSFWVPPRFAVKSFSILDEDGDGRIHLEEFLDLIVNFHRNNDPDAAGNWFFGPFDEDSESKLLASTESVERRA